MRTIGKFGIWILLILLISSLSFSPALSDVFNVSAGDVSALINALREANSNGQPDFINLAPGIYTLLEVDNTDRESTGLPQIQSEITLTGTDPDSTIIQRSSGASPFRIFYVGETGKLFLNGLTITGGMELVGGGILNEGILTLINVKITENTASSPFSSGGGGGIANNGFRSGIAQVELENVEISHNSAGTGGGIVNSVGHMAFNNVAIINNFFTPSLFSQRGGGITCGTGSMTFRNTTISGNGGVNGNGGGIFNFNCLLELTNVTISNNLARFGGAMRIAFGSTTISNSTIVENIAPGQAGGIRDQRGAGITFFKNTILARNVPNNCALAEKRSLGHNMDSDGTCGFTSRGDFRVVDPQIGSLADNGGFTQTHALLPGSRAIDELDLDDCTDIQGNSILTDQRGVPRPQGIACDIGAFEAQFTSNPRSAGFWEHQCDPQGFQQISEEELESMFALVDVESGVFPECSTPAGCDILDLEPPKNQMRQKAEREQLAVWLNVVSGRLPIDTGVEFGSLSAATSVGEAVAEIEATLCDPRPRKADLEIAKNITEALNNGGVDMELVPHFSVLDVYPGQLKSLTFGLVNMSPFSRSYELTVSSPWAVSLSNNIVDNLGSGKLMIVTAYVEVPAFAVGENWAKIHMTARDLLSEIELQRETDIFLMVNDSTGSETSPDNPDSGDEDTHSIRRMKN